MAADGEVVTRIGPYELLELLGEGGMGQVYLARSPDARLVALKVIRPEHTETPDFRARFQREIAAAQRVNGFRTPPLLDADAQGVPPWLATAYVPAPTLHEVVRDFGVLAEPALRALGAGLAEALAAIHGAGLVHRDLKPGNVLIAAEGPQVIDFGISRAVDGSGGTQITRTGAAVGTPGYLAPEQLTAGHTAGAPADVFSLGCVLVHAATSAHPFGAGQTPAVLYRVVHEPPQLEGVPAALAPLLAACLDKDPSRRPTVPQLLEALGPIDSGALVVPALQRQLTERRQYAERMLSAPPVPVASLPTSTLAPSSVPVPAQAHAPGPGPAPAPAPGPDRRRVLRMAAAGGGAALLAVGGGVAYALNTGWGDRLLGTLGIHANSGPTVSTGPAPLWQQPASVSNTAALQLLGDVLVCWDDSKAQAFHSATGAPAWTGKINAPPSSFNPAMSWLGVTGSLLLGTVNTDTLRLAALDAGGRQLYCSPVVPSNGATIDRLEASAGGVALLSGLDTTLTFTLVAVELASGRVLWSSTTVSDKRKVVSDGTRFLLYDSGTVSALDARTGRQLWAVPNLLAAGPSLNLTASTGVLLVGDTKMIALNPATGARLWTALDAPEGIETTWVVGSKVIVSSGDSSLFALDLQTGRQLWHSTPTVEYFGLGGTTGPAMVVDADLIAAPMSSSGGVSVFNTSDGSTRWSRSSGPGTQSWTLALSGSTLYTASSTTISAFRGLS
ncbi:protein kinase domain-containing protein [Streptacidiphilus fuscans]|uniref:PQQ-binding-like beta-propeller repeat protein n=1 Tax=Streptacidiphilus fuscans TaxID=2789292 RepID=A0A931FCR2_9ACTN|nr:PQQ-binding-like beta-propeller repeat protein [Streptacidiphilus fuscans]MBF9068733.1 PQQ-binding-like beta-propeller repeat protein [Streptacidiphilus fuscans]